MKTIKNITMKTIKKFLTILLIILSCNIYAQDIINYELEYRNIILKNDTITTRIVIHNYPKTEIEFTKMLDNLIDNIKFEDNTYHDLSFWIYISVLNDFNNYECYKQASEKLIRQMNTWLSKTYESNESINYLETKLNE